MVVINHGVYMLLDISKVDRQIDTYIDHYCQRLRIWNVSSLLPVCGSSPLLNLFPQSLWDFYNTHVSESQSSVPCPCHTYCIIFWFCRELTWLLTCIWFQMSQKAQLRKTGSLCRECYFYTFLQGTVYGLTVFGKRLSALKAETHNR